MVCKNCDKEIQDDFKMCPYCCTEIVSDIKNCRECGKEIQNDFKACPYCGASTSEKDDAAKETGEKKRCQWCFSIIGDNDTECPACHSPIAADGKILCDKCREVIDENATVCPFCRSVTKKGSASAKKEEKPLFSSIDKPTATTKQQVTVSSYSTRKDDDNAGIRCPKCGSNKIIIQPVTDVSTKHRGCIGWFFWLILVICTCGLLIIIPLITNSKTKSKTHTECTCQTCGNRWRL